MKLCMGCMNEIPDGVNQCPICGYDESTLEQESYYLMPGTVVGGKYIAGKVLDYNRYYITYLGWDAEQNRKVTIQEYLPSDFSTRAKGETGVTIYSGDALEQFEKGLHTFLNEGNVLEHAADAQGIARVYDCMAENDTGYRVNEYLEGKSLEEILDQGKKYELEDAMKIITPLLQGLQCIHASQVMHYDIRPDNVLITESGEVKLINFGAAKYTTTSNSKSLAIILKAGYAPEEQYRSLGEKGPWSDVYAVAALLYQMLTGTVPEEAVERAMIDNLKTPSELGVKMPRGAENALLNALNVYKEYRTPSAEQFLKELSSEHVKRIQEKRVKLETGKFPVWAKGLVAALVCVIVAGSVFIYKNQSTGDIVSTTVTMINTLPLDCQTARAEIEKLGAKCRIEYIPDSEDPEGTIWMQSVEEGKAIDKDTLIVLNVSGGTQKLTIPDDWVGQKKYDEVEQLLQKYNIPYEMEEDASGEKKGFHLISKVLIDDAEVTQEDIQTGSAVFDAAANHQIKLCYYKEDGRNYVFDLPDFVSSGATIEEISKTKSVTKEVALGDLLNKGYKQVPVYGKDLTEGKVVYQSVQGENKVSAKNELSIYYCAENLSYRAGEGPEELKRKLKKAGIICDVRKDTYSDSCPEGTIYSVIYPGQERYAKAGDTVTIHLSMGRKPIVTPAPVQQPQQPQQPQPPRTQPQKPKEKKDPSKDKTAPGI